MAYLEDGPQNLIVESSTGADDTLDRINQILDIIESKTYTVRIPNENQEEQVSVEKQTKLQIRLFRLLERLETLSKEINL